ncbi:MAG TPA: RNA methyltransferase [Candidatus Paceibacterota bacterium]
MPSIKKEIYLILDNIRSRENVGSIFRTADGAGVSKIYLCGITPCPPHPKISKTALGAETHIFWEYARDTWRVIDRFKKEGVQTVALEQSSKSKNIFKQKFSFPLALILGNEVTGLSPNILQRAEKVAAIPTYGRKESLNVSVACGIAVYHIRLGHNYRAES